MPERHLLVDHLKFSYEGLFSPSELYAIINNFFYENTWDWLESLNQEQVTPAGKQLHIVLEPWKSYSDFHTIKMRLKINMIDVKDVDVEHKGQLLQLSQGLVRMTIDAYVVSDRKGQWSRRPFYWFLLIILEKYWYYDHVKKMENWLEQDVDRLMEKIKSYVNTYK